MKKNWKKWLGLTLAAMLLVSLGGVVGALYSDWGSVAGNITAGTLDLTVNGSDAMQIVNVSNMKPGETRDFTWTLRNAGSVDAILDNGTFSVIQSGGAPANGPELAVDPSNNGNLSNVMMAQVYIDGVPMFAAERPISGLVTSGLPFSGMNKSLNAYATCSLLVRVHWPDNLSDDVDNQCQGDVLTGTANFKLTQKTA